MTIDLRRFITNESGQGITEYGAILAFIALMIVTVFSLQGPLADSMKGVFSSVATQLNSVVGGS